MVKAKAEQLLPNSKHSKEIKDLLMNTIRVPKNLLALSDKLPKANYEGKEQEKRESKKQLPDIERGHPVKASNEKKSATIEATKGKSYLHEHKVHILKQIKEKIIAKKQEASSNTSEQLNIRQQYKYNAIKRKPGIELPKEVLENGLKEEVKKELARGISKQRYLSKRVKGSQSIESISYNVCNPPCISDPFIQQIVNKRNPIIKSSSYKIKPIDRSYLQKLEDSSIIHRHNVLKVAFVITT